MTTKKYEAAIFLMKHRGEQTLVQFHCSVSYLPLNKQAPALYKEAHTAMPENVENRGA